MGYIMIALVLAAALAVAAAITIDFKINAEWKCMSFVRVNKGISTEPKPAIMFNDDGRDTPWNGRPSRT